MARFFGVVGYGQTVETSPGVYVEQITEREYYGDVIRNSVNIEEAQKLNNDLRVTNSISVVADAYANEHFHSIRYVNWSGVLWEVTAVTVESPRLSLRLGGVYNGPTPV